MPTENVYTRTMQRAIKALGSVERVAQMLRASVPEVEAWAAGSAEPPPGMFLLAIDIVAHGRMQLSRGAAKT